jgi:hypothetical protein
MFTDRGGESVRHRAPWLVGLKLTSQLMFPDGDRNSPPVAVCIGTLVVGPGTVVEVGELVVVDAGAEDDVVEAPVVLVLVLGEAAFGLELHAASIRVATSTTAPHARRTTRERPMAPPGARAPWVVSPPERSRRLLRPVPPPPEPRQPARR